jgi:hypothetical protein
MVTFKTVKAQRTGQSKTASGIVMIVSSHRSVLSEISRSEPARLQFFIRQRSCLSSAVTVSRRAAEEYLHQLVERGAGLTHDQERKRSAIPPLPMPDKALGFQLTSIARTAE